MSAAISHQLSVGTGTVPTPAKEICQDARLYYLQLVQFELELHCSHAATYKSEVSLSAVSGHKNRRGGGGGGAFYG